MLLDRGLLVEEGASTASPAGRELEVPRRCRASIAARLDGLAAEERRLLQDASVLGKTFTKEPSPRSRGLAGRARAAARGARAEGGARRAGRPALARARPVRLPSGPRQPSRLRDARPPRPQEPPPRRGAQLEASFGDGRAGDRRGRRGPLRGRLRGPARRRRRRPRSRRRPASYLARAGERAGSLAAVGEARRSFEHAAELADEPRERARLLERAGVMALTEAEYEPAERAFSQAALALLEAAGERPCRRSRLGQRRLRRAAHRARRAGARRGESLRRRRRRRAGRRHRRARVAARTVVRFRRRARAGRRTHRARARVSEAQRLPETLSPSAHGEGDARARKRPPRGGARVPPPRDRVRARARPPRVATGYGNLSDACFLGDRYGEALDALAEALALARRIGDRRRRALRLSETSYALAMTGRWDEALAAASRDPRGAAPGGATGERPDGVVEIYLHRGQLADARELLSLFGRSRGVRSTS